MTALLEMRDISKTFPGVRALDKVSLSVDGGSVHALILIEVISSPRITPIAPGTSTVETEG